MTLENSDKRGNCLKHAISPLATKCSTLCNNYIFIYIDFPCFCQDVPKFYAEYLLMLERAKGEIQRSGNAPQFRVPCFIG